LASVPSRAGRARPDPAAGKPFSAGKTNTIAPALEQRGLLQVALVDGTVSTQGDGNCFAKI
jgi:hypothetical protein